MRDSSISWTDSTWNPWFGCRKISDACKPCYMYRNVEKNRGNPKVVTKNNYKFRQPLDWRKGRKVFTCSYSDFFIEDAGEWRNEAWEVIKNSQQHTYQILTKRPERIKECLPKDWSQENYSNVWLGVTVENQETVHRIHTLNEIPCQLRWVSFEPLFSEVYLSDKELSSIDWAVIGGCSGPSMGKYKYTKTELSWFLGLMYQLRYSNIPIWFKQLGTYYHYNQFKLKDWKGEKWCSNFPKGFQIREFPIDKRGAGYGV